MELERKLAERRIRSHLRDIGEDVEDDSGDEDAKLEKEVIANMGKGSFRKRAAQSMRGRAAARQTPVPTKKDELISGARCPRAAVKLPTAKKKDPTRSATTICRQCMSAALPQWQEPP